MMKRFLTPQEAASYLGISDEELKRLTEKKDIPIYKIGGIYIRYRVDDLAALLKKTPAYKRDRGSAGMRDRIADFFYFNDFYIASVLLIILMLFIILKY